ncbi:hypothetical protein BDF21DRAFT_455428 [Thamnidium elegans]|nr:hypothetical protein BDF21DRAFT_455428 [Thamnidium elegans]
MDLHLAMGPISINNYLLTEHSILVLIKQVHRYLKSRSRNKKKCLKPVVSRLCLLIMRIQYHFDILDALFVRAFHYEIQHIKQCNPEALMVMASLISASNKTLFNSEGYAHYYLMAVHPLYFENTPFPAYLLSKTYYGVMFLIRPLIYFEEESPQLWTVDKVFESVEELYPKKERSFISFVVKKELETILNHSKHSHRLKAKELLDDWELPPAVSSSKEKVTNQKSKNTDNKEQAESSNSPRKNDGLKNKKFIEEFDLAVALDFDEIMKRFD